MDTHLDREKFSNSYFRASFRLCGLFVAEKAVMPYLLSRQRAASLDVLLEIGHT